MTRVIESYDLTDGQDGSIEDHNLLRKDLLKLADIKFVRNVSGGTISALGSLIDVSANMAGKSPTGALGDAAVNGVVTSGENVCILRKAGGADKGKTVVDTTVPSEVYGRLTYDNNTWLLHTYSLNTDGVETAYTFTDTVSVVFYFKEVYDLLNAVPLADLLAEERSSGNADYLEGKNADFFTDPSNLSAVVPVTKGGTGVDTLTPNGVLLGNGTDEVQAVSVNGDPRLRKGLCSVNSAAPEYSALPNKAVIVIGPSTRFNGTDFKAYADLWCDGQNDAAIINSALTNASNYKAKVVLLPGTYYLEAALTLTTGSVLEGYGERATITPKNGVSLTSAITLGIGSTVRGLSFTGVFGTLENPGAAITGDNVYGNTVVDCAFNTTGFADIMLTNNCKETTIRDNQFGTAVLGHNINLLQCNSISIMNNRVRVGAVGGIAQLYCLYCQKLRVIGNHFMTYTTAAALSYLRDSIFSNNLLEIISDAYNGSRACLSGNGTNNVVVSNIAIKNGVTATEGFSDFSTGGNAVDNNTVSA